MKSDTCGFRARICFSRLSNATNFARHHNKTCLVIPDPRLKQSLLLSYIKGSSSAQGGLRLWLFKLTILYINRVFDSAVKLVFLSRYNTTLLTQFYDLDKARFPS